MSSIFRCPACHREHVVPGRYHGRQLRCPSCGRGFVAEPGAALAAGPDPPPDAPPRARSRVLLLVLVLVVVVVVALVSTSHQRAERERATEYMRARQRYLADQRRREAERDAEYGARGRALEERLRNPMPGPAALGPTPRAVSSIED